jgi:hypothetical protein
LKTIVTGIWFDVIPDSVPEGLRCGALTMKPSCPLYDKDDWTDKDGNARMMTAYSSLGPDYDSFKNLIAKETGLDIIEYDTHYTLQVFVDVSEFKGTLQQVQAKVNRFVTKYFNAYVPPPEA